MRTFRPGIAASLILVGLLAAACISTAPAAPTASSVAVPPSGRHRDRRSAHGRPAHAGAHRLSHRRADRLTHRLTHRRADRLTH